MSTWDEKAKRHAMPNAIECPEDLTKYFGFKNGARWQREALLEGDVIERVAQAQRKVLRRSALIADVDLPEYLARAALTAAIEGEQ